MPKGVYDRTKARSYAGLTEEERLVALAEQKRIWRAAGNDKKRKRAPKDRRAWWCSCARHRARKAGLEAKIFKDDLDWPTHCPILGMVLDYAGAFGTASPTLDRWDNSKGYVKGNVFVISWRANALKSNATAAELRALADYAENGVL